MAHPPARTARRPTPAAPLAAAPTAQATADRPGWRLVWHDEFDGDAIDRTKWDFDLGNGFTDARSGRWVPGWGNEELQCYTADEANAQVRDGCLTLRAVDLGAPGRAHQGCRYTSARLKTRAADGRVLFATCYGRVEIRARVPWGQGLWPALWMLPVADRYGGWAASGEIDLMEIVGTKPHQVLNSIHFGSTFPARTLRTHVHRLPGGRTVADWHDYAVEWAPGVIRFEVDGVPTCTRRHWWSCGALRRGRGIEPRGPADLHPWPAPFDQPFYLVMNIAVGGNFPGPPDATTRFPAEMVIDHVRVYAHADGVPPLAPRGRGRLPWHAPRPDRRPTR